MGGTIAHKIQHGKSTAFTAEIQMEGEDARISFLCDRLKWSIFDVKVMPSTLLESAAFTGCVCRLIGAL